MSGDSSLQLDRLLARKRQRIRAALGATLSFPPTPAIAEAAREEFSDASAQATTALPPRRE